MSLSCRLGFHADWHRGRDASGQLSRICDRCQRPVGVLLGGAVIATPLVSVVAGEPRGKAQRERRDNVVSIRESQR